MSAPVLSVLIPAYNYASGVERILARRGEVSDRVEYIIFDDSSDDGVETKLASLGAPNVHYRRNSSGRGDAIANWNSLLERARGQFVVLVHHDEFPCRMGFFEDLAELLTDRQSQGFDVHLLGFRRLRNKWPTTNKLVPDFLRFFLLRRFPGYLRYRNFIGPSATFVARRSICPRFDASLTWLVDVDFYRRILEKTKKVRGLGAFCILSEIDRRQSISRTIAPNISEIRARDKAIISTRLGDGTPKKRALFAAVLEICFWTAARLAGALCLGGRYGA